MTEKVSTSMSKEYLLSDLETSLGSDENIDVEKRKTNVKGESANLDNLVFRKFLCDETNLRNKNNVTEEVFKNTIPKQPVPKPRKKKLVSPSGSNNTYKVLTPTVVNEQICVSQKKEGSTASNKTFTVQQIEDFVMPATGEQDTNISMIDINNVESGTFIEKQDTETLSDDSSLVQLGLNEQLPVNKKICDDNIDENIKCAENTGSKKIKKPYLYERILEIIIHKTDRLLLSSLIVHPVIKIHIVDASTGKYLNKSDPSRAVVFFYENKDCDYISPIMTRAYDLQTNRMFFPLWEETILINDDYEYFKEERKHIIWFFELLDFVSMETFHQKNKTDHCKGWYSIAFAFLKLSGNYGINNMGRKSRLQFYHSHHNKEGNLYVSNVWKWWKNKKLKKYPSTLYVTIKPLLSPSRVAENLRSRSATEKEISLKSKLCDDLPTKSTNIEMSNSPKCVDGGSTRTFTLEERNPPEQFKLPNKCLIQFNNYQNGCFLMKFSHNGEYLACAIQEDDLFYLTLYSVQSLQKLNKISAHQALIYCIKWSFDDEWLLSASADNTVAISTFATGALIQILPHPSFVYSCEISCNCVIASGCFDGTVRIWNRNKKKSNKFILFQELYGHSGYVTSLCLSKKECIFSADSNGIIIEWQFDSVEWVLKRHITVLDVKETIINQIILFSKDKKLLVNSRDNVIRVIDVRTGVVLQWLRGCVNKRFQNFSTISPCENFICAGSEDGYVHIWNVKDGSIIATYEPYQDNQFLTIHCVDFHPYSNMLAISHYGKKVPILIYSYDNTLNFPTVKVQVKHNFSNDEHIFKNEYNSSQNYTDIKLSEDMSKLSLKGVLKKMNAVMALTNQDVKIK